MIVGLLEAETLTDAVRKRFGSYGDMFVQLLRPLQEDLQFRCYAADQEQLPESPRECDAYIVTGSRHNAFDRHPWIEDLKQFIRELDRQRIKCLGICFGHQVVAEALGGETAKSEKGWGVGLAEFQVCASPAWLRRSAENFRVLVSHQDQVNQIPPSATRFAQSDFCPNGGYFIGSHIFCLQGHPEFNKDYVRFLIEKRADRIGESTARAAIDSLQYDPDRELLQSWLRDFLFNQQT